MCPFKGLASFEVADAPYFFGRERLVAELVARLVGAPLLGVVGPSGSGKSSVVRAGLLPALADGVLPGSEGWTQVVMRPGEHPLRELRSARPRRRGDRVLLAVDQFEETFTACRDEERARRVHRRARAAAAHAGRTRRARRPRRLLRALRGLSGARALLAAHHVLVGAMRRDELRRAVERPAQRVGLRVEPELADALVADVEHEPGALPLLSTALLELWQRRDGRRLRLAAYEATGGVRGAVARLAEDGVRAGSTGRGRRSRAASCCGWRPKTADGGVERRRVPLAELGPTTRAVARGASRCSPTAAC